MRKQHGVLCCSIHKTWKHTIPVIVMGTPPAVGHFSVPFLALLVQPLTSYTTGTSAKTRKIERSEFRPWGKKAWQLACRELKRVRAQHGNTGSVHTHNLEHTSCL